MEDTRPPRVAVIGAGPIGLEAAAAAMRLGCQLTVFEQGRVAEHIRQWGDVTLFSPFSMNAGPQGRALLEQKHIPLPHPDELLTGSQFVKQYLEPLADVLGGRIAQGVRVHSVSRRGLSKSDEIGTGRRAERPFDLLLRDKSSPPMLSADIVLDCSGTWGQPNPATGNGIPCPGELSHPESISYGIPDREQLQCEFAGKTVLVVGSGYSAATNVVALSRLVEVAPKTQVLWVTRRAQPVPVEPISNDQLPQRAALTQQANRLALEAPQVRWLPGRGVWNFRRDGGQLRVTLFDRNGNDSSVVVVDRIIANTGFRPDRSLYEELQVHECYATSGPMKLAAALLGEESTDCLAQSASGAELLVNPEPDFFILGAKSYGRNSRFLLRNGYQQVDDVFNLMASRRDFPGKAVGQAVPDG